MNSSVLLVDKREAVATVTLNRPEAMNAFSAELRLALGKAFRELRTDPEIRVAIVTGAGRAFCAGMDLKELSSGGEDASGFDKSVVGQSISNCSNTWVSDSTTRSFAAERALCGAPGASRALSGRTWPRPSLSSRGP